MKTAETNVESPKEEINDNTQQIVSKNMDDMKDAKTPVKHKPDVRDKHKGIKECWQSVLEQYKIVKNVGEGSFGSVYKAKCRTTG